MALQLRASQPETVFALTADMGAKLAEQRAANPGAAISPEKINP